MVNKIPERIRVYVCPECGWKSLMGPEVHYKPVSSVTRRGLMGGLAPGVTCPAQMVETVYKLVLVGTGPVGSTRERE